MVFVVAVVSAASLVVVVAAVVVVVAAALVVVVVAVLAVVLWLLVLWLLLLLIISTLRSHSGCDDPLFVDFIQRCLEWDPLRRLTPGQALRHPWIKRHRGTPQGDAK